MDKFTKNAAICLVIKSEKEDNYFIKQKIRKMKELCMKEEVEIMNTFILIKSDEQKNIQSQYQYLMKQIKNEQIQVLFVEEIEDNMQLGDIEIKKIKVENK